MVSFKLNNVSNQEKRISITSLADSKVSMHGTVNPTQQIHNGTMTLCLSAYSPPLISCDGATNETGVFYLSGAFDIELNGQVVASNLEPQALVDYLNGTGDLQVEVIIDTSWDIEYVLGGQTQRALTGDPVPFQYMNGSSATSLTINRTITNLSHQAFMNWSNATVLKLPDTLVYMGQYCFMEWNRLLEIVIPDSVVTIFGSAFQNANAVRKIVFGASLETVGGYSFLGIWNCKEIVFRSQTPPIFGGDVFNGAPADVKYYIPVGTREAYKNGILMYLDDSVIFEVP